jgi:superfamily II DNA helicase RecQ
MHRVSVRPLLRCSHTVIRNTNYTLFRQNTIQTCSNFTQTKLFERRCYGVPATFALVPDTAVVTKDVKTNNLQTFFTTELGEHFANALVKQFKIKKPSPVQELVIPEIVKGNDTMIAAQTGTGKTLAYLLPILYRMKQDEAKVCILLYL